MCVRSRQALALLGFNPEYDQLALCGMNVRQAVLKSVNAPSSGVAIDYSHTSCQNVLDGSDAVDVSDLPSASSVVVKPYNSSGMFPDSNQFNDSYVEMNVSRGE